MDHKTTELDRTPTPRSTRKLSEPAGLEATALAICEALSTGADARQALHEFIARACDALEADTGSVFLRGEEPGTLHVVAASDEPALARLRVALDRYPEVAAVLQSTQPLVVEDAPNHPLLKEVSALITARGIGSLLLFPVLVEGHPRAVLLFRRSEKRPDLDPARQTIGRIAAAALGLALSGARFREAISEQTNRVALSRIEAERRIRALAQYRDLFETAPDGMVVLDAEGLIIYLNRAGVQMTGFSRTGLVGQPFSAIVAEHHRGMLIEMLREAAGGARFASFDLELRTTSGDPLVVSASIGTLLSDSHVALLHFRDVTQARALEIDLRRTKDFLAKLIDSAPDGIVAADREGTIILFNKAAERIYGHSADEVVGRLSVERLYPPGGAQAVMRLLRSAQHGGRGRIVESRHDGLSKSGEIIPMQLAAAIVHEGDEEVATIGVFSDLREHLRTAERLRHAQEKLEISEKQALVTQLAGTTAHELNQPLTSILAYAELVRRRIAADDPQRPAIDTIAREAERMAEIVRKIGRITRYETKPYVGGTEILDLDKAAAEEEKKE
ncbi:MAG: PAS domain S-box protein [Myxococcota bacterium]